MMAKLAVLPKSGLTPLTLVRFLARMRILVLLLVLGQTECFRAKSALQILLRVVLIIVSLE